MRELVCALVLFLSGGAACIAKDQVLVAHQLREGLVHQAEILVPDSRKDTAFKLQGYYSGWHCVAWPRGDVPAVIVTCHKLEKELAFSPWRIRARINCDSEDSLLIDAVTLKCRGDKPVEFFGG